MEPKNFIGNPRITDYSFRLAADIQSRTTFSRTDLIGLYNYHLNLSVPPNALYPTTNWQTHRLCLMASIALKLKDTTRARQCHTMCLDWIRISDCRCCTAANEDFHFRDSCVYKIYGWWALCQAMVYLQPITQFAYKPLFADYFKWLSPYQKGTIRHIEFARTKYAPDRTSAGYGKAFDPNYNINLMRVYSRLTK